MKLKDMDSIKPEIAAEILHKSPQYVRIGLQQQRLPFGTAVKLSSEWTYHISYELLKNYVGKERIESYEAQKKMEECH